VPAEVDEEFLNYYGNYQGEEMKQEFHEI